MANIHDLVEQPLSDDDLRNLLSDFQPVRILTYSELSKYDDIQQLLPNNKDYVIILVQFKINFGHWVGLARNYDNIFYFDSYGYRVDKHHDLQPQNMKNKLNQKEPILSWLLNNAIDNGFNVYFNSKKYQKDSRPTSNINTCGRHVATFLKYFMTHNNPNFKNYYNYMNGLKNKYNLNYDYVVTKLTE